MQLIFQHNQVAKLAMWANMASDYGTRGVECGQDFAVALGNEYLLLSKTVVEQVFCCVCRQCMVS